MSLIGLSSYGDSGDESDEGKKKHAEADDAKSIEESDGDDEGLAASGGGFSLVGYAMDDDDDGDEDDAGGNEDEQDGGCVVVTPAVTPAATPSATPAPSPPHSSDDNADQVMVGGVALGVKAKKKSSSNLPAITEEAQVTASQADRHSLELLAVDVDKLLPPLPEGQCKPEVEEKFAKIKAYKLKGRDFNSALYRNHNFRNPYSLEKLADYCGVNPIGSNFPPDVWNPHQFRSHEFYDELAHTQKRFMERRQEAAANRTQVEFVPASGEPARKRTKWDQQEPGAQPAPTKQASSVAPFQSSGNAYQDFLQMQKRNQ